MQISRPDELIRSLESFYGDVLRAETAAAEREHEDELIRELEWKINGERQKLAKTANDPGCGLRVLQAILSVGILYPFSLLVESILKHFSMDLYRRVSDSSLVVWVILLVLYLIVFLVTSLIFNPWIRNAKRQEQAEVASEKATAENNIRSFEEQIENIRQILIPRTEVKIRDANNAVAQSNFPPNYQNSFAVGKFIEYLNNSRASTLPEAINLFETEMHQQRMLNEQRAQTEQARKTAAAAVAAAAGALATAVNTERMANSLDDISSSAAQQASAARQAQEALERQASAAKDISRNLEKLRRDLH